MSVEEYAKRVMRYVRVAPSDEEAIKALMDFAEHAKWQGAIAMCKASGDFPAEQEAEKAA